MKDGFRWIGVWAALCAWMGLIGFAAAQGTAPARPELKTELKTEPTFDCARASRGAVLNLICSDPELAAMDQAMAKIYAQALARAQNEHPPTLRAEQRGWIKGRDDCWKSQDLRACVADAYRLRTVELQARYRLVPITRSAVWVCEGNPANELVATFFDTRPPSLVAERGDQTSLMLQQSTPSGTWYAGRNESLREHQGEASVVWGYGAPEMRCLLRKP